MKSISRVTRDNLPQAVKFALSDCESRFNKARSEPSNYALIRDLEAALSALRLIDSELRGEQTRPRSQRSAAFTRYVIDERDRMVLDPQLRDMIVQIENVHARDIIKRGYTHL